MEWEITIHNDPKYVEIVSSGIADKDTSMKMAKAIANTMRSNKMTRALIDHRNIADVSGNVLDVYDRPKFFRLIGMLLGIKLAAVIKPEHTDLFKFLETVCTNQGYKYSYFYNKEDAFEWLFE